MANFLSETYKKICHATWASYLPNRIWHGYGKMFAYPSSQHALSYCKSSLNCCANFPHINLTRTESYKHHSTTFPTIRFCVYQLISHFTVHGRHLLYENKKFACVCVILILYHLEHYTQETSLLKWRHQFLNSTQFSTFH